MRKIVFIALSAAISSSAIASDHWSLETPAHVHGYERNDGTYVEPYYRAERGEREREQEIDNTFSSAGSSTDDEFSSERRRDRY